MMMTPVDGGRYALASQRHPDAGDHVVTADPAEREAAGRATDRSWNEFPYYAARYGDRGWRFGSSDGAWLATLCDQRPGAALGQVRWLAGLLAARGMPRLMTERHLELLHQELVAASPERAERYAVLLHCAGELRRARRAHLDDHEVRRIADAFEARVSAVEKRVPGMGALLAGTVADERAGVPNAVVALESWACDPARFPRPWIDAVQAALAEARAAAR